MEEVFVSQDWTNKSLTDDVKLAMYVVINGTSQFQYDRAEGYISVYKLSQNEVLNGINEIFGIDNGYNHTSVGPVAGCMDLKYNSNNAVYELYDQRGCGDMSVYLLKDKIFKTVKKGDSIEVTEKFYFVLGNEGVYKDFKFTQKIADLYDQNNSDYYFENGSTVTYTFKLAEDGSYYFDNSKITY
ncbi:MAG: hypothetical protein IJO43_01595 [Bacilli bacterium]|nr:hypothetical protein [Bacilli bacterium]